MGLFKQNPFGHYLILKKWVIRILGALTHRRFRGFNELQIEGSEICQIITFYLYLIIKHTLLMLWLCFMCLMLV
mgnify:CR=1 FL=1